jgi:5-methylthioadenosine/S-adenosylhomocysteine deaminase
LPVFGLNPEDAGPSTQVAMSELLKSGVTTISDLSMSREGWIDDLANTGIRAVVCPMMRQGYWYTKNGHTVEYAWDEKAGEKAFETAMKTIDAAMKHPSGRISAMVGPSQIDTCREGFFKEAHQEAKKRGIPMQTHACQAVVEFYEMIHRHGKTPIEWLDSIGVLGPDLVIGHGIFLSDHPQIHYPHANDFEMLRDSGAAVAHCPTVFARRGMALNTIGRYMNAGITVGIGTDTFPHNMVDEIRLACYVARVLTGNYKMGTTRHAFEAATVGGAKILRRPDLGRLAPGSKADFSLVDMSHPYMQPAHEPVRSLIYSASERAIRHVYVDGMQVVKDGKALTVDVEAATAGLIEGQRKRLETVSQRDWAGRTADQLAPPVYGTKDRLPQSRPVT